ncbi:hypothetical protein [Mycolicibacterium stellerae]|nr:hypothetical protein [Mycolicibacterium stellerae]
MKRTGADVEHEEQPDRPQPERTCKDMATNGEVADTSPSEEGEN